MSSLQSVVRASFTGNGALFILWKKNGEALIFVTSLWEEESFNKA
jgi:hypothetical protein